MVVIIDQRFVTLLRRIGRRRPFRIDVLRHVGWLSSSLRQQQYSLATRSNSRLGKQKPFPLLASSSLRRWRISNLRKHFRSTPSFQSELKLWWLPSLHCFSFVPRRPKSRTPFREFPGQWHFFLFFHWCYQLRMELPETMHCTSTGMGNRFPGEFHIKSQIRQQLVCDDDEVFFLQTRSSFAFVRTELCCCCWSDIRILSL